MADARGSSPLGLSLTRKLPFLGAQIFWWVMTDSRVALRQRSKASSLRSSARDAKTRRDLPVRVRHRIVSIRILTKKKAPISGSSLSLVGDDGLPRPASRNARGLRADALSPQQATGLLRPSGSSPLRPNLTRKLPSLGAQIHWWAMTDSNRRPCPCKGPAPPTAPIARRCEFYHRCVGNGACILRA